MKKTDIAMIILIATVSVMLAFFVTKSILGNSTDEAVKVKKIDKISAGIDEPSEKVFNKNAINPSVEVQITPSGGN